MCPLSIEGSNGFDHRDECTIICAVVWAVNAQIKIVYGRSDVRRQDTTYRFQENRQDFSGNESGTLGFVRSISTVWGYRSQVYASFLPYDPRGQKGRKHGNKSQKIYGQLQR